MRNGRNTYFLSKINQIKFIFKKGKAVNLNRMKIVNLPSYAKINLFLKVQKRYKNGYHKIITLFQSIDLHDEIVLKVNINSKNDIYINHKGYDIPLREDNTMYKALTQLRAYSGINFSASINITKNIPPCSGLGGGSSNAAVILLAASKLLEINITKKELVDIAKKIGADVAFFLYGGTLLAKNRGDSFVPTAQVNIPYILVVIPNFSLSTAEVYNIYDKILTDNNFHNNISDLKHMHFSYSIAEDIGNDLEYAVKEITNEIEKIKHELLKNGAQLALMSGSGSSVFGIFDSYSQLIKAKEAIDKMNYNGIITKSISKHLYWQSIKKVLNH